MRLHILSDLHIEHGGFIARRESCDAVIVAGDLAHGEGMTDAIRHLDRQLRQPWIYVPGNHDWYGLDLVHDRASRVQLWQEQTHHLALLDDQSWVTAAGGRIYRFIGSTWWSAMDWTPDDEPWHRARHIAAVTAQQEINDFRCIRYDGGPFTPEHARRLHTAASRWIRHEVDQALTLGQIPIIISHFLPTRRSIDPAFATSRLNGYFANDHEEMTRGVPLWVHGHTHASCDYTVASTGCRVVCNPKGYGRENSAFQRAFVITIQEPA